MQQAAKILSQTLNEWSIHLDVEQHYQLPGSNGDQPDCDLSSGLLSTAWVQPLIAATSAALLTQTLLMVHTKTLRSQHLVHSHHPHRQQEVYVRCVCLLKCLGTNITDRPVCESEQTNIQWRSCRPQVCTLTSIALHGFHLLKHLQIRQHLCMSIHLSTDPYTSQAGLRAKDAHKKKTDGESGTGVRGRDRVMSDCWFLFSACAFVPAYENKTQSSSSANTDSTRTLKQNNTNNINQCSYCTNIPRAFGPKLS